jgi:GntR family transcriptional regulator, transcriptional repressor for pyruvate dehydrogenase complex
MCTMVAIALESHYPLRPVGLTPAHVLTADQLRRAIHLGTYVPGDRLPPERDLARILGVSRVTLRQALRVLMDQGYLQTRRGAHGGLTVLPVGWTLKRKRRELIRRLADIEALLDFRQFVEQGVAELVVGQLSRADVDYLGHTIEALRASADIPSFRKADSAFHIRLAEISGNPYLRQAVEDARAGMFLPIDALDPNAAALNGSAEGHTRILDALVKGDRATAAQAAVIHIDETRREIYTSVGLSTRSLPKLGRSQGRTQSRKPPARARSRAAR